MSTPDWSIAGNLEDLAEGRRAMMRLVHEHADDPICGLSASLEALADPFYLGLDYDPDDSDADDEP
jgi:hypothetical protein